MSEATIADTEWTGSLSFHRDRRPGWADILEDLGIGKRRANQRMQVCHDNVAYVTINEMESVPFQSQGSDSRIE